MKKILSNPELTRLTVPTAAMKHHQMHLKYVLLSSAQHQSTKPNIIKTGWNTIMTKKPLVIGGLTFAVAALALTAATFINPTSSTASAQGEARASVQALTRLSPDDQAKVKQQTSGGIQAELQAAERAHDVQTFTYDQLLARDGDASGLTHRAVPAGYPAPDLRSLKYLRFTRTDGGVVTIGLDAQSLPVFESLNDPNAGSADSAVGPNGQAPQP
ncbi:MAG TPA: hypothetical protein VLI05_02810 [Candidatus Saccharimonadia bacterium]|nr:hypothetical protein [Candidatus Saccharimonadia bacterium]